MVSILQDMHNFYFRKKIIMESKIIKEKPNFRDMCISVRQNIKNRSFYCPIIIFNNLPNLQFNHEFYIFIYSRSIQY